MKKKKKIQALTLRIYFKKCSFIDLELFEIGCLRIVLGYITIGLVFFPLWRGRGYHADPPRINYLQKAQPKSHTVEIDN